MYRGQIYGGGPLAYSVGAGLVSAGVHLSNGYGGTEVGNPVLPWGRVPRSSVAPDPDWYWFRVAPGANVRFEAQGDGQYELVVLVSCPCSRLGLEADRLVGDGYV